MLKRSQYAWFTACSICLFGFFICGPRLIEGQTVPLPNSDMATVSNNASIVVGHAFSATKYSRLVKALANGKKQFLRNETYPIVLARDSDGRISLQDVTPRAGCDQLTLRVPPPCDDWGQSVFDPTTNVITHWVAGEFAGHVAISLKITGQQASEAEKDTSVLPENELPTSEDDGNVLTENLGTKTVEGVMATGSRTTIFKNQGKLSASRTIHEEWRSEDMRLIIKVIDGDPDKIERISGLEHISFSPDSSLFAVPDGYEVQHPNTVGDYVNGDLDDLSHWTVTQDPLSSDDSQ